MQPRNRSPRLCIGSRDRLRANPTYGLADRHNFMESGRIAWLGSSVELSECSDIWEPYLGV